MDEQGEIQRLRDLIKDVAAAPRGYLPDPLLPSSDVMKWAVLPREFMDKLDQEGERCTRP